MMGYRGIVRRLLLPGLVLAVAYACGNAGEDLGFGSSGNGQVTAFVYLDRDGSMTPNPLDTALKSVRVELVPLGETAAITSGLTDTLGLVVFPDIPLGSYRMVIDSATVGDSVQVEHLDNPIVTLRADAPFGVATWRVGYPRYSITEARALPAGEVVLVTGLLYAAPPTFSDSASFMGDPQAAIRMPGSRDAGPSTIPGDSVRVVGTTGTDAGQGILSGARIYVFKPGQPPPPDTLATGVALNAAGGSADARLVHITGAIIQDTATVNGRFRVRVNDSSGLLSVLFDTAQAPVRAQFVPGALVAATGVLVPAGGGVWFLQPRSVAEVKVT